MKRYIVATSLLVLWATSSIAFSQTASATPRKSPAVRSERGVTHSSTHVFNEQLLKAVKTISQDTQSEKLTASQAQTVMEKVKAIRVQELQFMKQNGNKSLTAEQIQQLTTQLNSLKTSL